MFETTKRYLTRRLTWQEKLGLPLTLNLLNTTIHVILLHEWQPGKKTLAVVYIVTSVLYILLGLLLAINEKVNKYYPDIENMLNSGRINENKYNELLSWYLFKNILFTLLICLILLAYFILKLSSGH